jgi:hypothetical protein
MSAPEDCRPFDELVEAAARACEARLAGHQTGDVSDETVQQLLTAGVRLFARKVDEEGRLFAPTDTDGVVTATDVAVTVTELLRVVDLNLFDLAMWANRARPGEEGKTRNG